MQYVRDPERIWAQNLEKIRELTDLSGFTAEQQEVVIPMVYAYGEPQLAQHIRFSANLINTAGKALKKRKNLLYDEDLIHYALDVSRLSQEPMHFLHKASVVSHAKANRQTRAMSAVECWKPYMSGGIVLIGQSATALFRLLEILKEGVPPPALVIAAPHGFVQATAAKQWLWDLHQELGVECLVVDGMRGGSALVAAAMNALLAMHQPSQPCE